MKKLSLTQGCVREVYQLKKTVLKNEKKCLTSQPCLVSFMSGSLMVIDCGVSVRGSKEQWQGILQVVSRWIRVEMLGGN
ncbi:hypothetical protein YC2023_079114 [Brassica napus]